MSNDLKLVGATVVDTQSGALSKDCTVVIQDGSIRSVLPNTKSSAPFDAPQLDVTGLFLIPGFNDMHTHALQDRQPENSLAAMLAFGITGIRQLAGSPRLLLERSQGRFDTLHDSPEILEVAGDILTRQNASSPQMAAAEIKRQAEQGADFIKVIDVDNATFFAALEEANRHKLPFLGHVPPTVNVAEASQKGMRSIEHLGPAEIELIACSKKEWLIRMLLKLKPPSAIDLSPENMAEIGKLIVANPVLFRAKMDANSFVKTRRLIASFSEEKCRKLARTFAQNHTWQCPTLIRLATMQAADDEHFTNDPGLRYVPNATRVFWTEVSRQFASLMDDDRRSVMSDLMQLELRMTKIFDEEGVHMISGSDYGGGLVAPGVSLHQEFDLLSKAGISALKILQMTTLLAAEFLGREQVMGTVEAGKQANLVLLGANPAESSNALHDVRAVIRRGRFYSEPQLSEMKERVAAHAASA